MRSETQAREDLLSRLREWGEAVEIHAGVHLVHANVLQSNLAEWLDSKEAGLGLTSLQVISPKQFRAAVHKAFPKVKSKSRKGGTDRTFFLLRYGVTTKNPPYEFVRDECSHCQSYQWAWQQVKPTQTKAEIIEAFKNAEDAAEVKEPSYIDAILERKYKSSG